MIMLFRFYYNNSIFFFFFKDNLRLCHWLYAAVYVEVTGEGFSFELTKLGMFIVIHSKRRKETEHISLSYCCAAFLRKINKWKKLNKQINQLEMNYDVVMWDWSVLFQLPGVTGSSCCEDLRVTSPRISYSLAVKWVCWCFYGWNLYTDLCLYSNWTESCACQI